MKRIKQTNKYHWIGIVLLSGLFAMPMSMKADLTVSIDEPSSNIVYDGDGNPFVVFGEDPADFSFDCSVEENSQGTFHYVWDFGSGDPSQSDDSTDSGSDSVNFSDGTTVTVNVSDELDDGTVCDSGSASIPVSQLSFTQPEYPDGDGGTLTDSDDNPVDGVIPDGVESDDDGNIQMLKYIKVASGATISDCYLGTMTSSRGDVDQFVDDNGDENNDVQTDESGEFYTYIQTTTGATGDITLTISNQ